jgi:hypothetical protein
MDEATGTLSEVPSAAVMTESRRLARNAIKTQWRAQGRKVPWVDPRELAEATKAYLDAHRAELISQAAANLRQRSGRLVPQIRTLAERMQRQHRGIHR